MPTDSESPKATYRDDPYRNFKFRVKWDDKYVAGFSRVSQLTGVTQATHLSGGDPGVPPRMPRQQEYQAITLERGVTHDVVFEQWANTVWYYHNTTIDDRTGGTGNKDVSLGDFRKDIILEMYDEAGQKVLAYNIYRCWPSEFIALPELDGLGNAVAIQSLTLENEGWDRDTSVKEPTEPSFTLPLR
jgi:phage tail-like protein